MSENDIAMCGTFVLHFISYQIVVEESEYIRESFIDRCFLVPLLTIRRQSLRKSIGNSQ